MRTSEQRTAQYDAKVDPATVGLKIAARLEKMKIDYEAYVNQKVQDEAGTILVMNEDAIPRLVWGLYFSFSSEMTKLTHFTDVTGDLAVAEAQALSDKWVSYGAESSTLAKIALNVFNTTIVCAT